MENTIGDEVEINGDFVTIRNLTFNVNDLVSFKPQSMAAFYIPPGGGKPRPIGNDFPKLIIQLRSINHELAYNSDEERDATLGRINKALAVYYAEKKKPASESGGNVNINVADSSHVNIVHRSKDVSITTKIPEAKELIAKIRAALTEHERDMPEKVSDIIETINDIEQKIDREERIPKLTLKSLIETTSDLAGVGSLVLSLAQALGML